MTLFYICGRITAPTKKQQQANILKFYAKAMELKEQGHYVINPASFDREDETWAECLARDVILIDRLRPTLFVMKGWEGSKGVELEIALAKSLQLKIKYE